jgi:hypothetical protein
VSKQIVTHTLLSLLAGVALAGGTVNQVEYRTEPFSLDQVQLLDGPFKTA